MELIEFARILFALLAVVGMIGLAAVGARKLGLQNGAISLQRARRLSLVETLSLDPRRKAAIIACDGREHLVILDTARVTVVERGIPARETAEAADPFTSPFSSVASIGAAKKLHVPDTVAKLLHRAPQDRTMALRAAGII